MPANCATRSAVVLIVAIVCSCLAIGVAAAQKEKKDPPAEPLDLNTATVEELVKLPEVGPAIARSIVRVREKSGPYRRVEDLLAVPGITRRRLEKIRPYVTVQPPAAEEKAPPKT